MPRAATTSDAFNAIAEPRRRALINVLARTPRPQSVNTLVDALRLPQPAVSKHLRVLRKVGLVSVHKQGQHRLYRLNPDPLRPVREWVNSFDRFWTDQLDAIKKAAEERARGQSPSK